ncbi:ATP-dependent DNA helicase RecG, partial [Patescibacteria group bacterium]|nr:ATP-dependent DNA helicase RecG [Patescibacteria group bacterium]
MLKWTDPLSFVHGFSAQQRRLLKQLEIETVGELLSILPRRYDDYSRLTSIAKIPLGQPVTIKAKLSDIKQAPTFRKRFVLIRALVTDESGSIGVTWFNQPWLLKQLKIGDEIYISGAITYRPRFGRGFTSPLWEPANAETLAAGNVAPVYPLTGSLTQKTLRKIMKAALEDVELPEDPIPPEVLKKTELPNLKEALRFIHRPSCIEEAEKGRERIAFGELLIYQLALRMASMEANDAGAPAIIFDEAFAKKFAASFPFELTADQKKTVWAAVQDMAKTVPMRRLVQGDVGSGKTAVAAMLSALVFRAGSSSAFMAPTDLLAKQHAVTFERLLTPHNIPVLLYTSSARRLSEGGEIKNLSVNEAKDRLARGRIVAVGTHALLEKDQSPPDLGLAVVDEQHRFGVAQREALTVAKREDGKAPHLLSMSATPIPRSLALVMLGDLDVSVIKTKPRGRTIVSTEVVLGEEGRDRAYQVIKREVEAGYRAFVVCPLIDQSDKLGVKSVGDEMRRLASNPLRGLRIGMVHGKMSPSEKDEAMQKFVSGELDVLVATTVVEVGVDVPQATVMMVEGAERFGLAQLHQLRGRVGRADYPSYCFLAATDDETSLQRLRVLERTNDGFEVAESDLRMRGEGNLLGTQQSGFSIFRAAKADDFRLMALAREQSSELLRADPDLKNAPDLRAAV